MAKAKTTKAAKAQANTASANAPVQPTQGQAAQPTQAQAALAPVPVPQQPAQTAQALARANVQAKVAVGVGVTHHTNGAPIKGLAALPQLAKPTAATMRYIASMGNHPGKGLGIKRWHLYKPGMALAHVRATPGLCIPDVVFWASHGLLKLQSPTPAQLAAAQAAWANGTLASMAANMLASPAQGQGKAQGQP